MEQENTKNHIFEFCFYFLWCLWNEASRGFIIKRHWRLPMSTLEQNAKSHYCVFIPEYLNKLDALGIYFLMWALPRRTLFAALRSPIPQTHLKKSQFHSLKKIESWNRGFISPRSQFVRINLTCSIIYFFSMKA